MFSLIFLQNMNLAEMDAHYSTLYFISIVETSLVDINFSYFSVFPSNCDSVELSGVTERFHPVRRRAGWGGILK